MRSRVGRLAAVFVTCVLTASVPTTAQVTQCGPNDVVPWWPRFNANVGAENLTATERAAVEARLGAVEALMRKTPYATPRGFAVRPTFGLHEMTDRTQLYPHLFALGTFVRCNKYDDPATDISVSFNPNPMEWSQSDRPMLDERGDGLYSEMIRTPTLFGATATFGRFHAENDQGLVVLFTTGGQSPTLPVTREEYLRAMIFTLEGKNGETVKAAAAIASKTPYERWMEGAAARRKSNEEIWAMVAKTNPAQAAKMRADMEKAELAETESLKKADAYERAQLSKNVAGLTAVGDKLRAQIAAMTPQERTSPAIVAGVPGNPIPAFVPAGTPNSWAIVRKDPAFYRAAGSPVAPKAIVVAMPTTLKEYRDQQEQLYKQLDWAAIKKMVN